MENSAVYRVVQWATGNLGMRALRAVLEHPGLDLVGLYVHSDAKAARDAGELCGLPAIGIKATRSVDEIIAMGFYPGEPRALFLGLPPGSSSGGVRALAPRGQRLAIDCKCLVWRPAVVKSGGQIAEDHRHHRRWRRVWVARFTSLRSSSTLPAFFAAALLRHRLLDYAPTTRSLRTGAQQGNTIVH